MAVARFAAVDLGAESGRVMLCTLEGGRFVLEEINRFPSPSFEENGFLRWNFDGIMDGIRSGLESLSDVQIDSVGVDSWGVDVGFVDGNGELIEAPYHYRGTHTDGMMEEVFSVVPRREVYERTGIQFMQLNTLYQLVGIRRHNPSLLEKADRMLFVANLCAFMLGGEGVAEYTLASTSQMVDVRSRDWARDMLKNLDLPTHLLPGIVEPVEIVGKTEAGVPIVITASHDTASAVAAVPAVGEEAWAYLSSGTWSLLGVEIDEPVVTDDAYRFGFTNEGGVFGTVRLLKNVMGLWILQECRRWWESRLGRSVDYAELVSSAEESSPFVGVVNPDDERFFRSGDMPLKIVRFLEETGQPSVDPEDMGTVTRIVLESLAFRYKAVLGMLERVTGKRVETVHVVGGGCRNDLLNAFTASALDRRVVAGPVEATAMGNALVQALAGGKVETLDEGRRMVASSCELKEYLPTAADEWDRRFEKVRRLYDD